MAIGIPTNLGVNSAASGVANTLAVTTTGAAAAGDVIRIVAINTGSNMPQTATDGTNNWSVNANYNNGTFQLRSFDLVVPVGGIASSTVITTTFAGTNGAKVCMLQLITGLAASPVDVIGAGATATSATASLATGTLSQANEIIFFDNYWATGSSADVFTDDNGYALVNSRIQGSSILRTSYKIVSSTASDTAQATNTSSSARQWTANLGTYKEATAAVSSDNSSLFMFGVAF